MVNLKVTSPSCRLKHLTIINCCDLLELEVDVMDLMSLELIYDGDIFPSVYIFLVRKKVPSLLKFATVERLMEPRNINFRRETSDILGSYRESGISSLKSLSLGNVNVTGELLEWLISQCHFLEHLAVRELRYLVKWKFMSSSRRLKHLEILDCRNMEELEIDIVNVMSLQVNTAFYDGATLVPNIGFPPLLKFSKFAKRMFLCLNISYIHRASDPVIFRGCNDAKGFYPDNGISSLKLKSLNLLRVKVSGVILEMILSQCELLEELTVGASKDLVNLRITESSVMLKHLTILNCKNMKQLELHSASLEYFQFGCNYDDHKATNLNVVCNNTSLVEAFFRGNYFQGLLHLCRCFSSHLAKLSLELIRYDPVDLPVFDNVKWLKLIVTITSHKQLFYLRHFAEAFPLLQEFYLQINFECECRYDTKQESKSKNSEEDTSSNCECECECWSSTEQESVGMNSELDSLEEARQWLETKENESSSSSSSRSSSRCSTRTLPHLTKLELVGLGAYSGHVNYEYSLAFYIIKNAILLEKFICDTRCPLVDDQIFNEADKMEQIEAVRKLAKVVPSKVQVVLMIISTFFFLPGIVTIILFV